MATILAEMLIDDATKTLIFKSAKVSADFFDPKPVNVCGLPRCQIELFTGSFDFHGTIE